MKLNTIFYTALVGTLLFMAPAYGSQNTRREFVASITKGGKVLCSNCNKVAQDDVKLFRCSQCNMVYYCSQKCQAIDWKNWHKSACPKIGTCYQSSESTTAESTQFSHGTDPSHSATCWCKNLPF